MKIIDSHAHISCDELFDDAQNIINRAKDAGIVRIMCICTSIEDLNRALTFDDDIIDLAFGIFPLDTNNITNEYEVLEEALKNKKIKAVGEIGLDYHVDFVDKEIQKEHFIKQIQIANKYQVPFIVHMRDATNDTIEIIEKYAQTKILIHCFSGSKETAKRLLKMGAYISFAGPITFKNAKGLTEIPEIVPLNRILIETDSPYLTPHPHRGKINEPMYVRYTFEKIMELKGVSEEQLSAAIVDNYDELFRN